MGTFLLYWSIFLEGAGCWVPKRVQAVIPYRIGNPVGKSSLPIRSDPPKSLLGLFLFDSGPVSVATLGCGRPGSQPSWAYPGSEFPIRYGMTATLPVAALGIEIIGEWVVVV
jgi:hypothetical protein